MRLHRILELLAELPNDEFPEGRYQIVIGFNVLPDETLIIHYLRANEINNPEDC